MLDALIYKAELLPFQTLIFAGDNASYLFKPVVYLIIISDHEGISFLRCRIQVYKMKNIFVYGDGKE
jgi:hypothetical protein